MSLTMAEKMTACYTRSDKTENQFPIHAAAGRVGCPTTFSKVCEKEFYKRNEAIINEADDHGCTPFHYAALYGNKILMHKIFEAGGDPEIKDENGMLPYDFVLTRLEQFPDSTLMLTLLKLVQDSKDRKLAVQIKLERIERQKIEAAKSF